jgi:hypothetical protein
MKGTMMAASIQSRHSTGKAHVSNYKKALLSVFDKKKTWNYLTKDRKKHAASHS